MLCEICTNWAGNIDEMVRSGHHRACPNHPYNRATLAHAAERAAFVFQAFAACSPELREAALKLFGTLTNATASFDERLLAKHTLVDILSPYYRR